VVTISISAEALAAIEASSEVVALGDGFLLRDVMDITAFPWGVLLKIASMTRDAFASSRESQMPYADHPTPLDRYATRVRAAACQYRRDCAILSEASAYAKLKSEQQRAMQELVTGEYWRMIAVRDAPHKEPIDVMTRHWTVSIDGGAPVHLDRAVCRGDRARQARGQAGARDDRGEPNDRGDSTSRIEGQEPARTARAATR
jgi:hypothetical protein